jgi:hypothetical protein
VIESAWGAVPGLLLVRFPGPLAEPAVLWVPKTCVTWADALQIAVGSIPRLGAGRAGPGPSGGGMIFGLWA